MLKAVSLRLINAINTPLPLTLSSALMMKMKEVTTHTPSTPSNNPKRSGPPPPLRRRKTRSTSTTSSSSSSSSSILSTPSPSHNLLLTPFHPSSSSVPFSWEHTPGIPKIPPKPAKQTLTLTLIPPPSRSNTFPAVRSHRRPAAYVIDPFAAALAECSKDSPPEPDFWRNRPAQTDPNRRRRSIADRFAFLDLHGSCKASCSVSEPAYRVLNRRS